MISGTGRHRSSCMQTTTNVHGKTPCRDGQHTWTDHLRLEGFSPGENEYAFGIEDFFGGGIYSDGGYKVTGPDGAVIAQGGEDLKCSDLPKTPCWTTVIDFTL